MGGGGCNTGLKLHGVVSALNNFGMDHGFISYRISSVMFSCGCFLFVCLLFLVVVFVVSLLVFKYQILIQTN